MPRDVSVKITANTSGFDSAVQGMAAKVQRSAAEIKSAADKALGSVESLAKGNTRLARAQAVAADAAEAVALAEARLEAVRKRAKVSVAANIAAENQLASAQRKSVIAQSELAKVQEAQGKSGFLARVKENEGGLNRLSGAMLKFGAVGAVGLGLSAKAAIDWDSAWAGVTKTVNGTPKQLALVESGLRGLARTMPETATQIAAVAENAGQLGIKTPDILAFTKTMVELGDTTNLSSDEAATSFGQLLNIMGDAPATVGKLGDVLVNLGNNGASTEKNILELGTRLAGAGKQIGLTTPQVLAFGSAISSTGIEAEAGGTAMSQNFFAIDKAVRQGGKSLDLYAKTAGLSSDQFRKAWGDNPASATNQFIEGLGRVQASGGSVRSVLDELGIKGARQADVYARLAGATKAAGNQADLLASSLRDAGNAQGALGNEAAIRYATSASKIKIALNKIHDDAITVGGALLPAISGITSGVGKIADKFSGLDSSTQKGLAGVAVAATGLALVGGAALKATTTIASAANALSNLGPAGARAAGVLGNVAKGLGIAAVAFAGFEAAEAGVNAVMSKSNWDSHLATSLGDAGQAITAAGKGAATAVPALDNFFQLTTTADLNPFTGKINGLNDAFKALDPQHGDKFFSVLTHGLHVLGGPAGSLDLTKQRFDQLDTVLTQVGTTNAPAAAKAFQQIRAQSDAAGHSLDELVNVQFNDYKKSLQDQATALGVTLPDSAALYADWMGGKVPKAIKDAAKANPQLAASVGVATAAIDQQKLSLQQLAAQASATSDALVAASNSEIAVQQALDAARQSAKTNGRTTNIKTEKGRANQSALNNIISAQHQNVQTEAALPHPDYAAIVKGNEAVKKSYIDTAKQMGVSSKQAKADADKNFKLPKEIKSQVIVNTDKLSAKDVTKLNKELKGIPKEQRAKIVTIAETKGAKEAEKALALFDKIKGLPKKQQLEILSAFKDGGLKAGLAALQKIKDAGKPTIAPKIKPTYDSTQAQRWAGEADKLAGQKVEPQITPKVNAAQMIQLQKAIKDLPKEQQVQIKSAFDSGGIDAANAKLKEFGGKPVNVDVTTSVDTSNLAVLKQFENPINTVVNVTTAGTGAANALINSTARPRTEVTRVSTSGVGAANALINTTSRTRTETTQVHASGVGSVNSQINSTARTRNARVNVSASGIGAVQSAINSIHGKTVTITVHKTGSTDVATGGLITPAGAIMRGPLRRSNGGPVWGAGTATSDSIPALLSNGEFVVRAAAVKAIGAETLARINAKGYATGGSVGAGAVGLTTDAAVLKAITAQFHVDQARNLAERAKADKELAAAMKKLNETQSAALDSIKSLSTSLQEPYRSKSTDVDDVLAALKDGATDLSAFGSQLKQLKAMGLQQGVIDQLTADGAVNGGELAGQILAGGQGLVDSLNKANDALLKAGSALGLTAGGVKGFASGGYTGDIGTSSPAGVVHGREYVVNAAATAANRSVLDAINYGRATINEHRFMPAYAGGGSSVQHVDRSINDNGQVVLQGDFGSVDRALSAARAMKRDNLTMARLTGTL